MTDTTADARPTVALVHGAFADSSGWNDVVGQLERPGSRCRPSRTRCAVSPLTPPTSPAPSSRFPGQLAVGHSYGGASITNAAPQAGNVVGLVYVVLAPDEGEALGDIEAGSKDSVLNSALLQLQYPTGQGSETAVEFAIDPVKFHEAFAADLPEEQAAVMAATQRPVAAAAFTEPNGAPGWKNLPSWAVVATGDKAAGSDVVRSMAQRAGAAITEVEGSARDHDFPAAGRHRRDPPGDRRPHPLTTARDAGAPPTAAPCARRHLPGIRRRRTDRDQCRHQSHRLVRRPCATTEVRLPGHPAGRRRRLIPARVHPQRRPLALSSR